MSVCTNATATALPVMLRSFPAYGNLLQLVTFARASQLYSSFALGHALELVMPMLQFGSRNL